MTPGDPVENLTPDQLEAQRRTVHTALAIGCVIDVVAAIVMFAIGMPIVGGIILAMAIITIPVVWRMVDRSIDERIKQASGTQPL